MAEIAAGKPRTNLDHIEFLRLGRRASERHDEILAEGFGARRQAARRQD